MVIFLLIIAGLCSPVTSQTCFLTISSGTSLKVKISEKIYSGDTLFTFSAENDVRIQAWPGIPIPFFIELNLVSKEATLYNFSLVSNTTVSLDDNETLCEHSRLWGFDLVCQPASMEMISIALEVNYTDDYDPVFNQSGLYYPIQELLPNNNVVTDLEDVVTDEDCVISSRKFPPVFVIEDGNTDDAFRLANRSKLVVNRLISYQKETHFILNISVTTGRELDQDGRTGFGKIGINIIDIDDNDPAFDNPRYILRVQEENQTLINHPIETAPRILAFDQDRGVNDSVTYSINGSSKVLEINNETGLVWTTRVLDREVQPSIEVTIKANQVHNSWRSALATLVVEVEDINDNRPMFSTSNPSVVSIPEHSATGLSIARVLAVDADIGENAKFNYSLGSEESVFVIKTDVLGNQTYGTVIVANSSALDRERISFLNITVSTEEHAPRQGGDCSSGMCSLNITIQLTDINDNSPVFDNSSYTLIVRNNTKHTYIGTVRAPDADEGKNAEVRYRCLSASVLDNDACSVTTINYTTGDIWLSQSLVSLQTYFALVEACDSPDDVSQKRCTTVPLAFSLPPNVTVTVTSYNFTVYENLPPEAYVGEIQNHDKLFHVQDKHFQLDDRVLRATVSLDREKQNLHSFVINTNNQDSTNISVQVTVLDVNDNAPVFDPSNGSVNLSGNERHGQNITVVNATDDDDGVNAHITYSLQPQSMLQYFQINATSGVITLQTFPSFNVETVELLVIATDGGAPSLSGFYTLRIILPPIINGSAVIYAPLPFDKIQSDKENIQSELGKVLGVRVVIEDIRQQSADSCVLYITAQDPNTGDLLTSEELKSLVEAKPSEIAALFRQRGTDDGITATSNQKSGDFTTPVIILIAVGGVLLIALIITLVVIARGRKSAKRHKRLIKSLSVSAAIYDTADQAEKDKAAILDDTDDEINAEAGDVTNPVFVNDEEGCQSVTLVTETEATSLADTEPEGAERDLYENSNTERPPDADSGVPSDRENGQEDDDDTDNNSNDGNPSPTAPRSSTYLKAVLDEPLLGSANPGPDDVVDVTSPGTYVNVLDGLESFPPLDESLPPPPLEDSLHAGPPDEPPVDFEEQESYITVQEGQAGHAAEAPLPRDEPTSHPDPEVESPDDFPDTESLDEFPVLPISARPRTPPMVRKSREQREEELEPLPEEPLPDYGKKVRFNFQVTKHEVPDYSENDANEDDTEMQDDFDAAGGNYSSDVPTTSPPSDDDTPNIDSSRTAEGQDDQDVSMNPEDEITSF